MVNNIKSVPWQFTVVGSKSFRISVPPYNGMPDGRVEYDFMTEMARDCSPNSGNLSDNTQGKDARKSLLS